MGHSLELKVSAPWREERERERRERERERESERERASERDAEESFVMSAL